MNDQLALDLRAPMKAARARADLGMQRCTESAERVSPGWVDRAAEALRDFARTQSEPFLVEAARLHIAGSLAEPPTLKSWGGATRRALALGYLAHTGEFGRAASSNGAPKEKYRAGANA